MSQNPEAGAVMNEISNKRNEMTVLVHMVCPTFTAAFESCVYNVSGVINLLLTGIDISQFIGVTQYLTLN